MHNVQRFYTQNSKISWLQPDKYDVQVNTAYFFTFCFTGKLQLLLFLFLFIYPFMIMFFFIISILLLLQMISDLKSLSKILISIMILYYVKYFNIYNSYHYIVFQKISKCLIVKRTHLNSENLIVIYFENLIVIYFERILVQICFVIEKK